MYVINIILWHFECSQLDKREYWTNETYPSILPFFAVTAITLTELYKWKRRNYNVFIFLILPFSYIKLNSEKKVCCNMADDSLHKPQYKTRSASISAPASSSLEAIINSQQLEVDSPEGGTPNYRRRKPATRSQSARIPSGRTVKKRFFFSHKRLSVEMLPKTTSSYV